MMTLVPPDYPAGPLPDIGPFNDDVKASRMRTLQDAPNALRRAVAGLTDQQLDSKYKNWSVRQIVHHLADSHAHSYLRLKWTLTESQPTIKAYEEGDWAKLPDCTQGEIQPSLALLDALHGKWLQVLSGMKPEQFERTFHHPQSGQVVSLWSALNIYAWHSQHHTAQILWLRHHRQW